MSRFFRRSRTLLCNLTTAPLESLRFFCLDQLTGSQAMPAVEVLLTNYLQVHVLIEAVSPATLRVGFPVETEYCTCYVVRA